MSWIDMTDESYKAFCNDNARTKINQQADKLAALVEDWRYWRLKARDVVERIGSDEELSDCHQNANDALDDLIHEAKNT